MSWIGKRSDKTDHRYTEERLSAFLDGELSPQEKQAVGRHLATCQACQWQLGTLRQTVRWTRELPAVPVPRVFTIPAPVQRVPAPRRRWNFVPVLQGVTALVALLLVLVVTGDVMFSGFLLTGAPQPAAVMEYQAADATVSAAASQGVEATQVVEVMKEVEVLEAEVVVEVEKEVVQPTPMPQALEAAPVEEPAPEVAEGAIPEPAAEELKESISEKAAAVSTSTPETGALGRMGFEATSEESLDAAAGAAVEGEAAAPPAPPPEAPPAGTSVAADEVGLAPTSVPTSTPTLAPTLAAPTAVAEVQEPVRAVREDREARAAGVWRQLTLPWVRVAELGLIVTLVLLGTVTVIAMIQRSRPR